MGDTLLGYAVFVVTMLTLLALLTVAGAWWLRWAARSVFLWVPDEKKRTSVPKRDADRAADDKTLKP